ncbi:DUF427 domain-containing protein [Streptomyces sp. TS71-3]|uniref:DUF427 domain-containing protein n=1 Tax=Streptomyces sp. TS71-3 TaxID=2733862 RepID=UPI002017059D|nr:DUF427 domain-containing protein [Streptomyces sp. TS71-3]
MKAAVGETAVAEAASEAVVSIEGNVYFPPDSVAAGALRDSPTPYTCPGRGWRSITTLWSARWRPSPRAARRAWPVRTSSCPRRCPWP